MLLVAVSMNIEETIIENHMDEHVGTVMEGHSRPIVSSIQCVSGVMFDEGGWVGGRWWVVGVILC